MTCYPQEFKTKTKTVCIAKTWISYIAILLQEKNLEKSYLEVGYTAILCKESRENIEVTMNFLISNALTLSSKKSSCRWLYGHKGNIVFRTWNFILRRPFYSLSFMSQYFGSHFFSISIIDKFRFTVHINFLFMLKIFWLLNC